MPHDGQEANGNGDFRITLKDVYQGQQESARQLTDTMHSLETTMVRINSHLDGVDTHNAASDVIHADFEQRLRGLERWRYALPASIVLAIVSITTGLLSLFGRH